MKKLLILLTVLAALFIPINAFAAESQEGNESINETIEEELNKFDFSALEQLRDTYGSKDILGEKSIRDIVLELAGGKNTINSETITEYILTQIIKGIRDGLVNLSFILFTVITCGVLKNMAADGLEDISNICEYVGFVIVVSMLLGTFVNFIDLTRELISLMQSFVRIIFPPLITLMTAIGGISSAGVFQPAMAVLSGSMIEFMSNGILPIGIFGGATGILGGISKKIKLKKLSDFCNSLVKWMMGIASTVYAGILSIQGMMAATYDGISIRTAKYTVDSVIPFIGGMMSDTVDTVLGCSLLLKNAIGFTGLLVIASMCILPLIRYVICILSYKLLGALIDTAADSKTSDAVSGFVSSVKTMFAIVCVIAAMTFITVALAINAGNTNVMLR